MRGIGASEIGTIVGLNKFQTPYQLWRKKTGIDKPDPENAYMKAGHYLEDAVSCFFQDETSCKIIQSSAPDWMYIDKEDSFLRVSPDRLYWRDGEKHNENNKNILECKTTQREIDKDDLPKMWLCQVQYQLGVSGKESASLAWLTRGSEFSYVDISFDADLYKLLKEAATEFWRKNIMENIAPDAVNAEDVELRYLKEKPGLVKTVDEGVFNSVQELKLMKMKIDQMDDKKTALEDKIKMQFEDAEKLVYDGIELATWKAPKIGSRFDTARFRKDYPTIADNYSIPTTGTRRLLIKV